MENRNLIRLLLFIFVANFIYVLFPLLNAKHLLPRFVMSVLCSNTFRIVLIWMREQMLPNVLQCKVSFGIESMKRKLVKSYIIQQLLYFWKRGKTGGIMISVSGVLVGMTGPRWIVVLNHQAQIIQFMLQSNLVNMFTHLKGVKNRMKEKQMRTFCRCSQNLSLSCMKDKWFLCFFLREIVNNRYNIA